MATFGFYGNRQSSSSSSSSRTPTVSERDSIVGAKLDQLMSLVERLQRDQNQLQQSIITLSEKVDFLYEKYEREQDGDHAG